ncbi:MAG: hypothetical protein ACRDPO_08780 [Streptosporangiaceae bacterium]
MTAGYRSWPRPAREMALAIDAAVSAARTGDAAAFTDATDDLGRMDREQIAVVLGAVTRELLERSHPDGLGSSDAEQVLASCIRSAASWYEPLDGDSLIQALTGTLGIHDPDESAPPAGPAVVAHGLLLIADQLTAMSQELPPVLDRALRELMRAQTIEFP